MAGGMTTPHQVECLAHMLGNSGYAFPANLYIGFNTAAPSEAGTPANEAATGTNRFALSFKAASNGQALSSGVQQITTDGNWNGTDLTHFHLTTTQAYGAGTYQWTGALTGAPISYTPGGNLDIPDENFVVQFRDTGGGTNFFKVTVAGANKWLDHSLGTSDWGVVAAPTMSLHNNFPCTIGPGNEFTLGGYARESWTHQAGTSGDNSTSTHSNALNFTNIQDAQLGGWALVHGSDVIYQRDQSNVPIVSGSTISKAAQQLLVLVD